jgi:hypothetical protein
MAVDESKSKAANVYVPVIVAIIGALAAVGAAYLGNRGSLTGVLPGNPIQTVTISAPTVTVTQTAPAETKPSPSPGGQVLWQREKMHFPSGSGLELEADSPKIDAGSDIDFSAEVANERNTPQFRLYNGAVAGLVRKASPSLAECQEALISEAVGDQPIARKGQSLCVQSESGRRLAALTVLSYDPESYERDMAVTVWDLE